MARRPRAVAGLCRRLVRCRSQTDGTGSTRIKPPVSRVAGTCTWLCGTSVRARFTTGCTSRRRLAQQEPPPLVDQHGSGCRGRVRRAARGPARSISNASVEFSIRRRAARRRRESLAAIQAKVRRGRRDQRAADRARPGHELAGAQLPAGRLRSPTVPVRPCPARELVRKVPADELVQDRSDQLAAQFGSPLVRPVQMPRDDP